MFKVFRGALGLRHECTCCPGRNSPSISSARNTVTSPRPVSQATCLLTERWEVGNPQMGHSPLSGARKIFQLAFLSCLAAGMRSCLAGGRMTPEATDLTWGNRSAPLAAPSAGLLPGMLREGPKLSLLCAPGGLPSCRHAIGPRKYLLTDSVHSV